MKDKDSNDESKVESTINEAVQEWLQNKTDGFQRIIDFQADRLDKQEAMIASLTMAYVEMFSAVDMMIKTIIKDYSPEEQEEFLRNFEKFRSEVLKGMQEASRSGTEGLDPEVKRAVEDVAPQS